MVNITSHLSISLTNIQFKIIFLNETFRSKNPLVAIQWFPWHDMYTHYIDVYQLLSVIRNMLLDATLHWRLYHKYTTTSFISAFFHCIYIHGCAWLTHQVSKPHIQGRHLPPHIVSIFMSSLFSYEALKLKCESCVNPGHGTKICYNMKLSWIFWLVHPVSLLYSPEVPNR